MNSVCNMKAILAVAVLAMAAFAGVMIVGDDTDAAATSITYSMGDGGDSTTKVIGDATVITIASPAELGFTGADNFLHWKDASGAVFKAGQQYLVSAFGDATNVILSAVFDENVYITLVVGDKAFKCPTVEVSPAVPAVGEPGDEGYTEAVPAKYRIDTASEQYKAAVEAVKAIDLTKYRLDGWFEKDATEAAFTDLDELAAATDFTASKTLTLRATVYFQVAYIVEGVTIATVDSDAVRITAEAYNGIPKAPIKDNYLFLGWQTKAGAMVFSYSEAAPVQYAITDATFKFTEDTELYAKFVPVTFTVTFVYGDEKAVFTTETVKYGECAIEPKGLPEGYKGWDWSFGTKIIADTEIVAIVADPVTIYQISFSVDGKVIAVYNSDNVTVPTSFDVPEGKKFIGWFVGDDNIKDPKEYSASATNDVTFVAKFAEADAPAGPGFFETTTGQCVAVLIAVVLIAFIYAVATNMFGLKDTLTSVKITRVKK